MAGFVILDRDGVINEDSPDYIKSPDEWVPLPGSLEAIALLNQHGIEVFVATNQAGIARGRLTIDSLLAIHDRMRSRVTAAGGTITDIRFCPHHPDEQCPCRKPRPGLLEYLAASHDLDLTAGDYVGDSLTDLQAAEAVHCRGILVLTGNGQATRRIRPHHQPVWDNLLAYAKDRVAA